MASTTLVRGQPQQWERGGSVAYSEQDPESHHHGKPTMERPGESRDLPIPRRATEATHSTTNDLKDSKATWNTTECTRHPDKGQRSLASRQGSTLPYHNSTRGLTLYCSRVLGYRKPQSPLYWSGEQEATPVQISKRPKTADRELESRRIGSPPRHEWVRATPLDPRRPKPEGEDSLHGDRRSFQPEQ